MHAFFDGYINSKTTLKQFVEQYENALRDKVEKEKHADFSSLNTQIPCITHYAIEKQFQAIYTNAKFREFQQEVTGKLYCEVSLFPNNLLSGDFVVKEYVQVGEDNHRFVAFIVHLNEVNCEANCNCRLFKSKDLATNNEGTFCMVMEAIDRLKAKLTLDGSGGGSSQCCANLIKDAIGNEDLNNTSNEKSNIFNLLLCHYRVGINIRYNLDRFCYDSRSIEVPRSIFVFGSKGCNTTVSRPSGDDVVA
ncbi:hypothetical protein Ddye_012365 [Dipteronia dyeriana]|uniref:Protein FAR1-RELATED SEQUENCE n=1 Tax=Dipteronia dyeriana TaxID=168575 RepID=A0AAE0CIK0_9ROSI|nr:hypothetical protein Ddye_012365 [Dipteronia dyeriana]